MSRPASLVWKTACRSAKHEVMIAVLAVQNVKWGFLGQAGNLNAFAGLAVGEHVWGRASAAALCASCRPACLGSRSPGVDHA